MAKLETATFPDFDYRLLYNKDFSELQNFFNRYMSDLDVNFFINPVVNPCKEIIDTDVAFATKGLTFSREDEETEDEFLKMMKAGMDVFETVLFNTLVDGVSYVEIGVVGGGIDPKEGASFDEEFKNSGGKAEKNDLRFVLFPVRKSEIEIKDKDLAGNIVDCKITVDNSFRTYSKEYKLNEETGELKVTVELNTKAGTYTSNDYVSKTINFVPVVEIAYTGSDATRNEFISRLKGIEARLLDINGNKHRLDRIFEKNAEAVIVGDIVTEDEEGNTVNFGKVKNEAVKNGGLINYKPNDQDGTGTESKIFFLEMKGDIAQILKSEKDDSVKELKQDYPEKLLNNLMEGSAMSGFAVYLKLISLVNIIDGIRKILKRIIEEIAYKAHYIVYEQILDMTQYKVEFDEIISYNSLDKVNELITAWTNGGIDQETFVRKMSILLNEDFQTVWNKIQSGLDYYSINAKFQQQQMNSFGNIMSETTQQPKEDPEKQTESKKDKQL